MRKLSLTEIGNRIDSIHAQARIGGFSSVWLSGQIGELHKELNSRTAAGHRRYSLYCAHYASGYAHACWQAMWTHLEFCYQDASGKLYSTHRQSVHARTEEFYAAGRGAELGDLPCTHVWKGTAKPFAPFERIRRGAGIEE